jgi:hypothetical protein
MIEANLEDRHDRAMTEVGAGEPNLATKTATRPLLPALSLAAAAD